MYSPRGHGGVHHQSQILPVSGIIVSYLLPCKKGGANNVGGVAHACEGVRRLAEYILRAPFQIFSRRISDCSLI